MVQYSIVVVFHNEEDRVTPFYVPLKQVMEQTGKSFELVFVEAGSTDRTYRLLAEIAAIDSRVLVVKLRRYFGETGSLAAGIDHATGEFVLTMDCDPAHNSEDIPRILEKLDLGYDVVSGFMETSDASLWARTFSRGTNWLTARFTGVPIHAFRTGLNAYRRALLQSIPLYGEMRRFIPALAESQGASVGEVPMRRQDGQRKRRRLGFFRMLPVVFDLLTIRFLRFVNRPLHFFGRFATMGALAAGAIFAYLLGFKAFHPHLSMMESHGPLAVSATVLLLAAIQLLGLGLLCELQVRHYYAEDQSKPYTIDRVLRLGVKELAGSVPQKHESGH